MYNINDIKNTIILGDVLEELRKFPNDSIDMVITSPPYYGLRKYSTQSSVWGSNLDCIHQWEYGTKKGISGGTKSKKVHTHGQENFQIVSDSEFGTCILCGAWFGELGGEPAFQLYIEHLLMVCDELRRIIKPEGSLWWNIDDSRSGSNQGVGSDKSKAKQGTVKGGGEGHSILSNTTIAKKSLMGIPDRFKIGMIDRGWVCRNEIIWHKPNQMPDPAKDRFTDDFEKLFFFTKNGKYYFEQQIEPYTVPLNRWSGDNAKTKESGWDENTGQITHRERKERPNPIGKNKRTVWSINTKAYKSSHVAVFPTTLIETPIKAGCPENGIVLDPFMGSGTTGYVAKNMNKNFIGIERNPEYIYIANKRIWDNN